MDIASRPDVVKRLAAAMRFYLSPANLCHDKVVARYLTQQKRVPLDIFLTFNQVKDICTDLPALDLLKAAVPLLESARLDGDYIVVEPEIRTSDIDSWKEQAEMSTVYVESVPDTWNREQVRCLFAQFGEIVYISLPRFSETQIVKGFAFVQFRSHLAAQAALALTGTDSFGSGKLMRVLSKAAWKAYKPQFALLQERIQAMVHSSHASS